MFASFARLGGGSPLGMEASLLVASFRSLNVFSVTVRGVLETARVAAQVIDSLGLVRERF